VSSVPKAFAGKNPKQLACALLCLLAACQPTQDTRIVVVPEPEPEAQVVVEFDEAAVIEQFEEDLRYQRMIADLLYEGIKALNANRLLTPPDISAHAYFSRVLSVEPANAVALNGVQEIVSKYLLLAEQAGRQGQFDNARQYLRRAEDVDHSHSGIAPAWVALEAEMNSSDVVHTISPSALASRSTVLMEELAKIGVQARDSGAFFLITAPNDAQARWIYSQMQAGVAGHRLRGNIELGDSPTVRLILPNDNDA
jgi:5-enolpyruvylshikimate-3-phosphate synthase